MAKSNIQAPPPLRHEQVDECAEIIFAVDARARDIERRWGHGILPRSVPLDIMEKFNRQKRKFSEAAFIMDLDECRKHGASMLRAFEALEQAATNAGNYPEPVTTWEFELADGQLVVLVRDRAELTKVDTRGRAAQVWSLDEIASVIERFPMLSAAKAAFPGAEVASIRPREAIAFVDDVLSETPFAKSLDAASKED